jgi:hypothetical protein
MIRIIVLIYFLFLGNISNGQKISKAETMNFLKLKFHASSTLPGEIFFLSSGIIRVKFTSDTYSFISKFFVPVITTIEFNISDVAFKKNVESGDYGFLSGKTTITTIYDLNVTCSTGNCINVNQCPEFSQANKSSEFNKNYTTDKYFLSIDNQKNLERLVKALNNLQSYYPVKKLKEQFD